MSASNGPRTEPRSSLPSLGALGALGAPGGVETTMLDLIAALCDITPDDRLVVLAATHLINTRGTRLKGMFRNVRVVL